MMPSFYTPDGTGFRDPRRWAEAAVAIRDLAPDYLINQYGVPLTGKEKIPEWSSTSTIPGATTAPRT